MNVAARNINSNRVRLRSSFRSLNGYDYTTNSATSLHSRGYQLWLILAQKPSRNSCPVRARSRSRARGVKSHLTFIRERVKWVIVICNSTFTEIRVCSMIVADRYPRTIGFSVGQLKFRQLGGSVMYIRYPIPAR